MLLLLFEVLLVSIVPPLSLVWRGPNEVAGSVIVVVVTELSCGEQPEAAAVAAWAGRPEAVGP